MLISVRLWELVKVNNDTGEISTAYQSKPSKSQSESYLNKARVNKVYSIPKAVYFSWCTEYWKGRRINDRHKQANG